MAKQKVICVVGPTASGKSALAVRLAKKYNGEVISADSRQVYTGLDIGTGKMTKREMKGVRHHLLDVRSPKKIFTAHDFEVAGRTALLHIAQRGKMPIVCGGTFFYIDTLLGRQVLPDVPVNAALRARLEKKTAEQLMTELRKKDPRRARSVEPQNKRRIIRAIEIADALGKNPIPQTRSPYHILWIGIKPNGDELRTKINKRLSDRLKSGMVNEARRLHAAGLSYKRMVELGLEYRSLSRFLQKRIDRAELEQELRSAIWRYSRKQLSYARRNKDIEWFTPTDTKKIERVVGAWLKR